MSIVSEITRLQNAKSDIKASIENKGVTVGDGTIDTYASKINEISTSSAVLGTKTITKNGIYKASDDNLDGYSSVDVNVGSFTINNYAYLFAGGARIDILNDLLPLCKGASIAYYMFDSCWNYTGTLDLTNLDVSKIYRTDNMFQGLGSNTKNVQLKLPEIKTNLSCGSMFQGFGGDVLDISPMVNGQSFSKSYMFWNASFTKLIINKPYVFPLNSNDLKGTTIEKGTGYVYVPDPRNMWLSGR